MPRGGCFYDDEIVSSKKQDEQYDGKAPDWLIGFRKELDEPWDGVPPDMVACREQSAREGSLEIARSRGEVIPADKESEWWAEFRADLDARGTKLILRNKKRR